MGILELRNKLKVDVTLPEGALATDQSNSNKVVQFYVRPYFHLNTIHFSLFQRIKLLLKEGFKCSILLQDRLILHGSYSETQTEEHVNNAMDTFYKRLFNWIGIENHNYIEIIPESILWKIKNFKNTFYEKMIKLSYLAEEIEKEYEEKSSVIAPFLKINSPVDYLGLLSNIIYEGFLKPEYVHTGGKEKDTILKDIRTRVFKKNLLKDSNYRSPTLLIPPKIHIHSAINPTSIQSSQAEDPFSRNYSGEIKDENFNDNYKKTVQSLYSITSDSSKTASEIINEFRSKVYE